MRWMAVWGSGECTLRAVTWLPTQNWSEQGSNQHLCDTHPDVEALPPPDYSPAGAHPPAAVARPLAPLLPLAMATAAHDVFTEHLGVISALRDNYARQEDASAVAGLVRAQQEAAAASTQREDQAKSAIKGEGSPPLRAAGGRAGAGSWRQL